MGFFRGSGWPRWLQSIAFFGTGPAAVTPPVAAFSGDPLTGYNPQDVDFTDESTNTPTSWSWETNDGGGWVERSTVQNPTIEFGTGTHSVRLTATNAGGNDTETKTDYIIISEPPAGPAVASAAVDASGEVLQVAFDQDIDSGSGSASLDATNGGVGLDITDFGSNYISFVTNRVVLAGETLSLNLPAGFVVRASAPATPNAEVSGGACTNNSEQTGGVSSVGPILAGSGANTAGGGLEWTNVVAVSYSVEPGYALNATPQAGDCVDFGVYATQEDGFPAGGNRAAGGAWSYMEGDVTYGGPDDLWDYTWAVADIKGNAEFGLLLAVQQDPPLESGSVYIWAKGFNFSALPDGATVVGIEFTLTKYQNAGEGTAQVRNVRCTVYYTGA